MDKSKKTYLILITLITITTISLLTIHLIHLTSPSTPPIENIKSNITELKPDIIPDIIEPQNPGQNPLALDSEGYYIADIIDWTVEDDEKLTTTIRIWSYIPYPWDPRTSFKLKEYIKNGSHNILDNDDPIFFSHIELTKDTISSGEALTLNGISETFDYDTIPFLIKNENEKPPYIQKDQTYSAPPIINPNRTPSYPNPYQRENKPKPNTEYHFIRTKIPALNIHINPENITTPLEKGTLINGSILITTHKLNFTIIYDPKYPMIIENTQMINLENTTTTWAWTSQPNNTHTWINPNNRTKIYTQGYTLNPYPTFPKPAQSW